MASDSDLEAYLSQLTRRTQINNEESSPRSNDDDDSNHSFQPKSDPIEDLVMAKMNEAKLSVRPKSTSALKSNADTKLKALEQKYLKKTKIKLLSSEDSLSDESVSMKPTFKEVQSALELQESDDNLKPASKSNQKNSLHSSKKSLEESSGNDLFNLDNIMTVDDFIGRRISSNDSNGENISEYGEDNSYSNKSVASNILSPELSSNIKETEVENKSLKTEKERPVKENKPIAKPSNLQTPSDSPFMAKKNKHEENNHKKTNLFSTRTESPFLATNSENEKNHSKNGKSLFSNRNESPFLAKSSNVKIEKETADKKEKNFLYSRTDSPFLAQTNVKENNRQAYTKNKSANLLLSKHNSPFLSKDSNKKSINVKKEKISSHSKSATFESSFSNETVSVDKTSNEDIESIEESLTDNNSKSNEKNESFFTELNEELNSSDANSRVNSIDNKNKTSKEKKLKIKTPKHPSDDVKRTPISINLKPPKNNKKLTYETNRSDSEESKTKSSCCHKTKKSDKKHRRKKYVSSYTSDSDQYITIKIPKNQKVFDSSETSTDSSVIYIPHDILYRKKAKKRHKRKSSYENVFYPPYRDQVPFHKWNEQLLQTTLQNVNCNENAPILRVEDALKQTVDLTRQFMESQKLLYHSYSNTLASSYHYTSLKKTEDYINSNRKPPLTFKEAYKLVLEEESEH